jgi:hypothetical protein
MKTLILIACLIAASVNAADQIVISGVGNWTGTITLTLSLGTVTNPVNATNIWVNTYGGTQADEGLSVKTDASSNVFFGGYFSATANFGQGNVTASGGEDIVIAKYNFGGTNQWVKTFGSTSSDRCDAIALDSSGNVYAVGYFNGTINMGGTNLVSTGGRDVFIAKYNNAGTHQWSRKFGSVGDEIAYAVTVDSSGDVYMSGFFQGTSNFGTTNMSSANNGLDTFVAKYTGTTGAGVWSKRFSPNNSDDISYGIAACPDGGLMVCGVFQGTCNFGGTNHPPTGGYNMYIVKLSGSTGGWIWDFAFGGTTDDFAYTVAVDSSNNVLFGGFFNGTVNFGGGNITTAGSADGVAVKLNSSGAYQWARQLGGITSDTVMGTAFDSSGNAFVSGAFSSSVNFGSGPSLVSAGQNDGFLAKYSSANVLQWVDRFGGTGSEVANSVSVDTTGYVLSTGSFSTSFNFMTIPVTSAGLGDIYLWRHIP